LCHFFGYAEAAHGNPADETSCPFIMSISIREGATVLTVMPSFTSRAA
jgi:hypothetical protein